MPFFTIIVPTYNRASFLAKAIGSVEGQTFADWELIVIDDGSTDNSREVVEPFLADKRVTYVYQENQERCVARNKGINRSRGTYITFLDSDDYFLPNRLQLLHDAIVAKGQPVAFFYTGICFENKGVIVERGELENTYNNIYDFIINAIIHTQQACIHRSLLMKHQFDPRFTIGEDMELWLRIAQDAEPQFLDGHATYVAVEHEERSVNVKKYNSGIKHLALLRHIYKPPHPGHLISNEVKKKRLSDTFFSIAKYHIYNRNKLIALKYILYSIVIQPSHCQTKHKILILLQTLSNKKTQYSI